MLVVTVRGDVEDIEQQEEFADVIEFRFDLLSEYALENIASLVKACKRPVMLTPKDENLFKMCLALEPAYLDIGETYFSGQAGFPKTQFIVSHHNYDETPQDLDALFDKLYQLPADIYKIATQANSSLDSLRMLLSVKNAKRNVCGLCMGEKGSITRILAPCVSSHFCYTFLNVASAEGQVDIKTLLNCYHVRSKDQSTELYGLIGRPVTQSPSHITHNQVFHELRANSIYVKMDVLPEELKNTLTLLHKLVFKGVSITIPHKEQIKLGKAINTLTYTPEGYAYTNTDGVGMLDVLKNVRGKRIVILGAGGTAHAVLQVLKGAGGDILLVNRTKEKGLSLAERFSVPFCPLNTFSDDRYDILINTTSVGMETDEMPICPSLIVEGSIVVDVICKKTRLAREAHNRACRVYTGWDLFAAQAVRQFKLWGKNRPDLESIFQAVSNPADHVVCDNA